MDQLVPVLVQELVPWLDRPYVFYGHCIGGTIAFEVARALRRMGHRQPSHLFIGGIEAPHIPWSHPSIRSLPELEFLEEVQRRYNGLSDDILVNPHLRTLVLPALRADVTITETYRYLSEVPLDCGITALGGTADPMVSESSLRKWQKQTRGTARIQMFAGGHFFLHSAQEQLLALLNAEIRRVMSSVERERIPTAKDLNSNIGPVTTSVVTPLIALGSGTRNSGPVETVGCPPETSYQHLPRRPRSANNDANSDPANAIERALTRLWEDLLGLHEIGLQDDFFNLGGHSLIGVQLLTRIECELKKSIPLHVLFETRTIKRLAAYVHEDDRQHVSTIVPMNTDGTGAPFFCVHSLGGETASFRHLVKALGPEYNFCGVQKPANVPPSFSIEDLARNYVDDLLAEQPEGPYILGGWSAGSIIALEMAHQLISLGKKVALVVALDGAPCNTGAGTPKWNPIYYWKLLRNFPLWVAEDLLVDFSGKQLLRRAWNKVLANAKRFARIGRGGSSKPDVSSFCNIEGHSHKSIGFMNELYGAMKRYVPKRYDGKVVVYQSRTEPLHHLFEIDRVWQWIADDVEIVRVPGTHLSLVCDPYVNVIADDLRHRLDGLKESSQAGIDSLACSVSIRQAV